jgi:hypothetical protein
MPSLHIESRSLFEKNPALREIAGKEKHSGSTLEPFFNRTVRELMFHFLHPVRRGFLIECEIGWKSIAWQGYLEGNVGV